MLVPAHQVERHGGEHFKEEAAAHDILLSDGRMADLAALLAIVWQPEEPEDDIQREKGRDHVLREVYHVIADVELDGGEVHRREARVDNNGKHDTVPEGQKRASRHELHAILAALSLLLPVI